MAEGFTFDCPKCGIPMKRSGREPKKGESGAVELTCPKCGKRMMDFMIPNEEFFGPGEVS